MFPLIILAGAGLAALVLSGCDGDDGEGEDGGSTRPDSGSTRPDGSTHRPPECGTNEDRYVNEGETISFPLRATDPDGDPLTFSSSSLPSGATLNPSGLFRWQPNYDQAGAYTVPFNASDGTGEVSCEVTVHVNDAEPPAEPLVDRVSVRSAGVQGNGNSDYASISADGRFVAFRSAANNLVPGDTNDVEDVFVYDRLNNTTQRASVSSLGVQGNDYSGQAFVSGNGGFVSFYSRATNLVASPGDNTFLRDLELGTTELVNLDTGSTSGGPVFISNKAPLSFDGRYVAFEVPGRGAGEPIQPAVYLRDRLHTVTELISVVPDLAPGYISLDPSMSANARFVAFLAEGTGWNLYLRDRGTGITTFIGVDVDGHPITALHPSISADGNVVAYGGGMGVYARDLTLGGGVEYLGAGQQPSVSGDGRFVTFMGVGGVMVHDMSSGVSRVIAQGEYPALSADGRFVAFDSGASDLVPGDTNGQTDVFVVDIRPFF